MISVINLESLFSDEDSYKHQINDHSSLIEEENEMKNNNLDKK